MAENGKWQVGFWIITALTIGLYGWTTVCHLYNRSKIEQDYQLNRQDFKDVNKQVENLSKVANDCLHKIDLRLSRIEYKLKIPLPVEK
jgi:hypothetical protein